MAQIGMKFATGGSYVQLLREIIMKEVNIDGNVYQLENLPSDVVDSLMIIQNARQKIDELSNVRNFFNKAKAAYLEEIKHDLANNEATKVFGND